MQDRVAHLEAALREIADIAAISECRAAKFYGMLAEKALENNSKKVE